MMQERLDDCVHCITEEERFIVKVDFYMHLKGSQLFFTFVT